MPLSTPESIKAYREAGRIAAEVRARARKLVTEGRSILEICDKVEQWTVELGGSPAFPCNVGVNESAAHYTSGPGDQSTVPRRSVVKIDIGVHVDGYIADTATTVSLSPELARLARGAEAGLRAATETVKAGIRASEVGAAIEKVIKEHGLRPIWNLTGHQVSRYSLHAGEVIPNVRSLSNRHRLGLGDVYAIEPFTTPPEAPGEVINGQPGHIYLFLRKRPVKNSLGPAMLDYIRTSYKGLPFTDRWLLRHFREEDREKAFQELVGTKCLHNYSVLVEKSRSPVCQAEHTVLVTENGCEVFTDA